MPPKKTVQTTLGFRINKASGAVNTKDKTSGGKPKATAAVVLTKVPAPEEVASVSSARGKKDLKKHRKVDTDDDGGEDDDDDDNDDDDDDDDDDEVSTATEIYVSDDSESDGPVEPQEVIELPKAKAAEPEVCVDSSTSEDEASLPPSKGKQAVMSKKELMKEGIFKEGYADAKEKVAGELTVSARYEARAKTILRTFDLSYEYGPCVGMTRRERWNRAFKLGLNPPEIVRRILDTEKVDKLSKEDLDDLLESVFHGMV